MSLDTASIEELSQVSITISEVTRRLSRAYDLVCTKLVIPGDTLAMPVGGRDKNSTKRKWFEFAEYG
jgi:hypothetical protein